MGWQGPWLYDALQGVLRLWVKFRTNPEDASQLGPLGQLGPPMVYCFQVRQLSDLLILNEACARLGLPSPVAAGPVDHRSAYYLSTHGQPSPLQRRPYRYSKRLVRLIEAVQSGKVAAVRVVPVSVFWGRSPEKTEGVMKALFSDGWGTPGALRQLIRSILHGRQTIVKFGEPLLIDQASLPTDAADRRVARLLRNEFRRERELAIGPNLSHRQTLVNQLIESPRIQQAIALTANDQSIPLEKAELRARAMAVEIASDYSYPFIRFYDVLLSALWNRIYNGVQLHRIQTLRQVSAGATLVYVPCHRSHIDYMLLSYVIYYQGLPIPHIAAGDNLNIPVLGNLLRKGGAFFLRRSFKGDKLYASVFEQYLHLMITSGFPIEYFVEGGRSRTGRMLAPKAGMLAMTLDSFMRESQRPLVFVPVYIGYERLFEGSTYVAELSGQPKQKESIGGLIKSLRALKENFGKVHLNIGEPIHLESFLDETQPDWRAQAERASTSTRHAATVSRTTVSTLAYNIVTRINDAVVVNPINLLALAFAGSRPTADRQQLQDHIDLIRALLTEVPYSAIQQVSPFTGAQVIEYASSQALIVNRPHPLGDLIEVPAKQWILLTYYRNNVLHTMVLPALLAALVSRNERIEPKRVLQTAQSLFPFLRKEYFLSLPDDQLEAMLQKVLDRFIAHGLLKTSGAFLFTPPLHEAASIALHNLAQILREPLERFAIVAGTLARLGSNRLSSKQLEDTSHAIAQRVALLHETTGPQFYDRAPLRAIISTLGEIGLVRLDPTQDQALLQVTQELHALADQVMLLLPVETRISISHLSQPITESVVKTTNPQA
jgi:glycerol-3-phosphate O-acyltransferase